MSTTALSPFVYWGQTESTLSLRVDLKGTINPIVELTDNKLHFSGEGYGARGQNQYLFHIEFFAEVNAQESFYRVIERDIEFVLKKKEAKLWPRLMEQTVKPAWLKVDFDKIGDDSEEEEIDADLDWKRTPNLMRDIINNPRAKKQKRPVMTPEEFRKVYLFLYNLFQFVASSYILLILGIRYAKEGGDAKDFSGVYSIISIVMKVIHFLRLLEVVHPFLGYTTGSVIYPGVEVALRLFLLLVIDQESRLSSRPVVANLFLVWSLTDFIRHAYYMVRVFDVETFLTWIHYTAWFVLFPLSFLCEGVVILYAIGYYEDSKRFSLSLPNPLNTSFSLANFLRIFLLFAFFPSKLSKNSFLFFYVKLTVNFSNCAN